MASALGALLRSRKALVALSDFIFSLILYFVGKYAAPSLYEDVKFLIGAMQPVVLLLIAAIAVEDAAAKRANGGVNPHDPRL